MPRSVAKTSMERPPAKRASRDRAVALRDTLNIRIKAEDRGLIDRAAEALGKTRTDFMLEASRRAAEEALLERRVFLAGPQAYEQFLARLDAPPRPNDRLRRTLTTKAPWDAP
jgi:uncharacterized protein (DUF1778 family)